MQKRYVQQLWSEIKCRLVQVNAPSIHLLLLKPYSLMRSLLAEDPVLVDIGIQGQLWKAITLDIRVHFLGLFLNECSELK